MEPSAKRELRLLVVEDETLIAMELEDILHDLGHRVLEICGTVPQAVAFLDANADGLDGAILDANLGGTSAEPVAKALRERRVPFVVASGYSADELRRLGIEAPRIRKPYRKQEIEAAVAGLKARRQA
jgi:DNA-binding response OmpR family regulator